MDDTEREELILDLKALFAELRRLGYLDGYRQQESPARPCGEGNAPGSPGQLPRMEPSDRNQLP
jgi:hypothetical protein